MCMYILTCVRVRACVSKYMRTCVCDCMRKCMIFPCDLNIGIRQGEIPYLVAFCHTFHLPLTREQSCDKLFIYRTLFLEVRILLASLGALDHLPWSKVADDKFFAYRTLFLKIIILLAS